MSESALFSAFEPGGYSIRRVRAIALLSLLVSASMPALIFAEEVPSSPAPPLASFSMGAGYERYRANWISSQHPVKREVFQNRIFLQVGHWLTSRLRVGAKLGAAELSAPDLDAIDIRNRIDYGFAPFGTVNANWTPIGALPGARGCAIEILSEMSAFAKYAADRIQGSVDAFETNVQYEAWPQLREMWEGRLSVLLAVHNGSFRFSFGPMLLRSGAATRTRAGTSWTAGVWNRFTLTDYFATQNEVGVLYALRFSPWLGTVIDAEVVVTPPSLQFEVSLARILSL